MASQGYAPAAARSIGSNRLRNKRKGDTSNEGRWGTFLKWLDMPSGHLCNPCGFRLIWIPGGPCAARGACTMRAFANRFAVGAFRRLGQTAGIACLLGMTILPALAQDASPDRLVAEWMLRMGGSVVLEGQHTSISDIANLPSSAFYVQTLNFTGITQWASALEDELRRLPPVSYTHL